MPLSEWWFRRITKDLEDIEMKAPTEQQLRDPEWWDENAPEGATHYWAPSSDWYRVDPDGTTWAFYGFQWRIPCHGFRIATRHIYERPANPEPKELSTATPDRSSPEWKDWKIAPGSWPYWMLERMHRETGRMSYDNPVKGIIRDLWAQVSNPSRQEVQENLLKTSDEKPDAYMCRAGCGCLWRDNGDDTMSLYGPKSQSCDVCEMEPLKNLIPVKKLLTKEQRDRNSLTETIAEAERLGLNKQGISNMVWAAGWRKEE